MVKYKNIFRPFKDSPLFYETDVSPVAYKGYLIYQRIKGTCFDIVKDSVCLGQYAGINGAKKRIDELTT